MSDRYLSSRDSSRGEHRSHRGDDRRSDDRRSERSDRPNRNNNDRPQHDSMNDEHSSRDSSERQSRNREYNNNNHENDEERKSKHNNIRREGPRNLKHVESKGPTLATPEEYEKTKHMQLCPTFESMHLKADLLKGLLQYGIIKPSAVQQRVMLPILQGHDVIAQAPAGTGKTTIFAIALLQIVDTSFNKPQALALFPTRELAQQTRIAMKALGSYMNVKIHNCIGGVALSDDIKAFESGVHVITGTPGRVYDNIKRGSFDSGSVKAWLIDEADQMFSHGFKDQLYYIFRYLPNETQIMLVSATFPQNVLALTSKFMTNPIRILVQRDELSLQSVKQFFLSVQAEEWKYSTLVELYDILSISQSVVFVNSREKCEEIATRMKEDGYTVDFMHGGLTQEQRDQVMINFRSAKSRILITTDIWGRGIDVQQVSLVVNYDLPESRETYLHRIGRSGRFGKKGIAINLTLPDEKQVLDDIAQHYSIIIEEMPASLADA